MYPVGVGGAVWGMSFMNYRRTANESLLEHLISLTPRDNLRGKMSTLCVWFFPIYWTSPIRHRFRFTKGCTSSDPEKGKSRNSRSGDGTLRLILTSRNVKYSKDTLLTTLLTLSRGKRKVRGFRTLDVFTSRSRILFWLGKVNSLSVTGQVTRVVDTYLLILKIMS